jgi:TRAP-type uncharacterized transport system fused permease subunit
VVVLIWNLMVEELSPALSAFWATMFLIFILVTQRPLIATASAARVIWPRDSSPGLQGSRRRPGTGARNMIGIGIATAAAGIIVGTVTLTGIGLVMTELVELISGGNLMLMLAGGRDQPDPRHGLPTTANYIVVSTLMAPVVVELGAQSGCSCR